MTPHTQPFSPRDLPREMETATAGARLEKLRRLAGLRRALADLRLSERSTWDSKLKHLATEFVWGDADETD